MTSAPARPAKRPWLRVIGSAIACGAILAGSVYAVVWINRTEPTAQTINAKRKSSALVETITVARGTFRPKIRVLGTVQAAREINLSPRVEGQVAEMSPQFVPGGMVRRGDTLVRLDRSDYENAVAIARSEMAQTEASLAIEGGRQSLAKKEMEMLAGTIAGSNRSLMLRVPQLASIRAEVQAAQAAVDRAQLDLDRTELVAPFDAQVLTRSVNVGSQVRPGDQLGRLVGTEEYWVSAAVPVRSLRWIEFATADDNPAGSTVRLRDPDAWGPDVHRDATVSRMIGSLDDQTRLARVLITVADPLSQNRQDPPLILGSLIDVEIDGKPIDDVVRLPRSYLHDGDTVWLMRGDELKIQTAQVVFGDAEHVYVSDGLFDGDEVITTTLATVADGVKLRRSVQRLSESFR